MKALLHKSEISNKISGLKNEMKKSYSSKYYLLSVFFYLCYIKQFFLLTVTNFDDVYHRKIASSQSQNEVILFTRKSRTHLNMGANKTIRRGDSTKIEEPEWHSYLSVAFEEIV